SALGRGARAPSRAAGPARRAADHHEIPGPDAAAERRRSARGHEEVAGMSRIIAGRFDVTVDADGAIEALRRGGFARDEIASLYVGPAGQNDMTPLGGDALGASVAGFGAVAGALGGALLGVLVALAIDSRYGAAAVLFAAGLGAYLGSFLGAVRKVRGA